ncbi:hypothetical protein FI615_002221 [Enterococcus faecium]|nr:hypothetical protein [Enterococcus faecium]
MRKWQKLNKMEKGSILFIGSIILASSCFCGYMVYADKQKQQEVHGAEQVVVANQNMLKGNGKIVAELNSLMNSKGYLNKGITQEDISKLVDKIEASYSAVKSVENKLHDKKTLNKYKSSYEAEKQLIERLRKKFLIQQSVNKMFESKDNKVSIVGSEVNKELSIIKNVDDKKIEWNQKELATLPNDEWKNAVITLIGAIKTQKQQTNEAVNLVDGLFDKEKPKPDVSNENYDKAKSAVDKVKNEEIKKELVGKLEQVKKLLDEHAKKEVQEQETKQEQANNTVEASGNLEAVEEASDVKESVQEQAQSEVVTPAEAGTVAENNGTEATGGYSAPVATPQAPQNTGSQGTGAGATQPQQSQASNNSTGQIQGQQVPYQNNYEGTRYGSYEEADKAGEAYLQKNSGYYGVEGELDLSTGEPAGDCWLTTGNN